MLPDVSALEIRRYLLGDLDEAAAAALEARYFVDAALADEIRAGEEALVDAYVAGQLADDERGRFDSHYLASPVHRDRVATARALRQRLAARPGRPAGAAFYGWLTLAAAVVVLSLWLVGRPAPPPQQAQAPPVPAQPATPGPTTPPTAPAPAAPAPAPPSAAPAPPLARAIFALTISPIAARGGAQQQLHQPPPGPVDLVIRLEGAPDPSDRAYEAELQNVDGQVVWRGRSRPAAAGSGLLTTLRVPAETLSPNDYVFVITANRAERGRYVLHLRAR